MMNLKPRCENVRLKRELESTAEKTPTTKKYSLRHGLSSDDNEEKKILPIYVGGIKSGGGIFLILLKN